MVISLSSGMAGAALFVLTFLIDGREADSPRAGTVQRLMIITGSTWLALCAGT